jgi:SAM-dependent methyltransferase
MLSMEPGSPRWKSQTARYTAYDPFAWAYDRHWGNAFRGVPLAVMDEVLFPGLRQGARVLDLCCGTGHKTFDLVERGYKVTGLDGSSRMLRYARKNAPGAEFVLGDARSFAFESKFEAVVCMFDSLNHIMSIAELGEVFRCVYSALARGGSFLFDFTTQANFLRHRSGVFAFVEDDHVCINQISYDADSKAGAYEFTLFRLQRGEWRRSDFTLEQRSYEPDEVRKSLADAGFHDARGFTYSIEHGLQDLSADSARVFLLCRKSL